MELVYESFMNAAKALGLGLAVRNGHLLLQRQRREQLPNIVFARHRIVSLSKLIKSWVENRDVRCERSISTTIADFYLLVLRLVQLLIHPADTIVAPRRKSGTAPRSGQHSVGKSAMALPSVPVFVPWFVGLVEPKSV